ncbi:nickel-dependent lactate racemase [Nocardioides zeae]|uniref:Nickel-dependent lactate racemase n=1 Tax=Nocardioides imazamoxiresistens TaxID=3231893 RepID=A0ABU3PXW7_9ACTN|nr:nickel-dependent lactate racemase [Nocardioides zeae]MDT9594088.1 nickel-dependent lactate racemase [Nocardioides zeae]
MDVTLAYGETRLSVDLPEGTTVVEPSFHPGAPDQAAYLREVLATPVSGPRLRDRVRPGQTVAISMCDSTRPQPRHLMLPAILEELEGLVDPSDVTVLVATGTHRGNTEAEIRAMVGDELADLLRIVNHDARDRDSLTWVGELGAGVPVWLNTLWVEADVRITTGFVEPHFFAGFSGGPKLVAPGLAALETVLTLHDAARIGDPRATWGVIEGNPVHDDVRAIAAATDVTFAFDVILNRDHEIVRAFCGDILPMHEAAREAAREIAMREVDAPFDVVVTTNSGYPLDQNLYQAVKGMSAAFTVVKPGGTIICAAECRDGFPDHGSYREVLASAGSPQELFDDISARTETVPDQWQVQIQAKIQSQVEVVMHTSFLSDEQLAEAHLRQTDDIGATVREICERIGPDARVCVLPEGPQTIPYVAATVGA